MSSEQLSYKPSVFYFRRALRESANITVAQRLACDISREFEMLREWAGWYGVLPETDVHVSAEILREAIGKAASHGQAILLGLFLCHELEQLKANVHRAGLVPPKCIVARAEAEEKGVPFEDHAAHLLVHGTLHLLGYDHLHDSDAAEMETREVRALARLGIANPYEHH